MFYSKVFKTSTLLLSLVFIFGVADASAQDRKRVVEKKTVKKTKSSRPVLRNQIVIKNPPVRGIKKTGSSKEVNASRTTSSSYLSATKRSMMMDSINKKMGIRYRYGTQGPRSYDCSGFIWKVFNESGVKMIRTSAREFWRKYEPVTGDERFEFGTLVFFNRLGHVGIVASKDGFYHASSSKGVTYSKFKGYWSKRIVGYRRIPVSEPIWEDFTVVDEDTDY